MWRVPQKYFNVSGMLQDLLEEEVASAYAYGDIYKGKIDVVYQAASGHHPLLNMFFCGSKSDELCDNL
jgi:hypothetical protein